MTTFRYKTVGVSLAAVFTMLAVGTLHWWQPNVPFVQSQHEAEIMLSIINRDAAMIVTDSFVITTIGTISNVHSTLYTNLGAGRLGALYSPGKLKWTAWDTNMFWKGGDPAADESFTIVSATQKVFTNAIVLVSSPGASGLVLKHYKGTGPATAYWRKEPPMGINASDWTFWYGTETVISGTNHPVVVSAELHPYHTTGFPSGGGGYPTTTPVSDSCGVITLQYEYGMTYTNTIGLYPNASYRYPDLARAQTLKTAYLGYWNYWLVPSNTFVLAGDWDGNYQYDPSPFYMSNFGSDTTPMRTMWTNWVTLPVRNYSVTTNYAITNYVGTNLNIHYYQTNFHYTASQEVFYPVMTFAFERDHYITPFISTNAYNDLARFESLLQWQLDNSVQVQSRYYEITLDVSITGTPSVVKCTTTSVVIAGTPFQSSYMVFDAHSDAPPGYHYTNSFGTLNYRGYQAVITNRTPFAFSNGYFWVYVGNYLDSAIDGTWFRMHNPNPYPSQLDDLWAQTNKLGSSTAWYSMARLYPTNWVCPAYGTTNSDIVGYTPAEVTNLFPQFVAVIQSFKDTEKTYYYSLLTTNADTSADAFPSYGFSANSKTTNNPSYFVSHGNHFAAYRVIFTDALTNYLNHAPVR